MIFNNETAEKYQVSENILTSLVCGIYGIFEIDEQVIRYNLVWVSLRLINREWPVQQFQIFLII